MRFFDIFDRTVEHDDTRGDSFHQQKRDKNQQNIDQSAWLDQEKWSTEAQQDVHNSAPVKKKSFNKDNRRSNKYLWFFVITFVISVTPSLIGVFQEVFFHGDSQNEIQVNEEVVDQRSDGLSEEENKVLEILNSNQIAGSFELVDMGFLFYPNSTLSDYLIKIDKDEAELEEYNNLLYNWVRLSSLIEEELGEGYMMVLVAPWNEAVLVVSDGNIIENDFAPIE